MAQHFLYTFEFVVGDLLITRPNKCAPEEYPTCVEITFRSSVFVSIFDRDHDDSDDGSCGKGCLFALECPVTHNDRLLVHVYKKKDENCKFLLGASEMPIALLFEKVTSRFDTRNPKWLDSITRHHAHMVDPKLAINKQMGPPPRDYCYDDIDGRREHFCLTSEVMKGLLPLYNERGDQTGNIMLIVRLICNGPAIVTELNLGAMSRNSRQSRKCSIGAYSTHPNDPCKALDRKPPQCRRYFASCSRGCPF